MPSKAPTSQNFDSIGSELRFAGDRALIQSVIVKVAEFVRNLDIPPEYRKYIEFGRAVKRA
jgi:plasmid replication initiation protein